MSRHKYLKVFTLLFECQEFHEESSYVDEMAKNCLWDIAIFNTQISKIIATRIWEGQECKL